MNPELRAVLDRNGRDWICYASDLALVSRSTEAEALADGRAYLADAAARGDVFDPNTGTWRLGDVRAAKPASDALREAALRFKRADAAHHAQGVKDGERITPEGFRIGRMYFAALSELTNAARSEPEERYVGPDAAGDRPCVVEDGLTEEERARYAKAGAEVLEGGR